MNYKEDIIRYRLERAEETYQEALLMQREKHWNTSAYILFYRSQKQEKVHLKRTFLQQKFYCMTFISTLPRMGLYSVWVKPTHEGTPASHPAY